MSNEKETKPNEKGVRPGGPEAKPGEKEHKPAPRAGTEPGKAAKPAARGAASAAANSDGDAKPDAKTPEKDAKAAERRANERRDGERRAAERRDPEPKEKEKSRAAPNAEQVRARKEEQARRAKRRSRQLLGVVLSVLVLAGVVGIVRGSIDLVNTLLDDTAEMEGYTEQLTPLVWFDQLPFESVAEVDQNSLKQVAIWYILNTQNAELNRNDYGQPLVPAIEIDRYAAQLFGPEFRFTHGSFEDPIEKLEYTYDEASQVYICPATGLQPPYLPTVVSITRESGGIKRVTMGYVRTRGSNNEMIDAPDFAHPAKYMDYMFRRDGNNYYLFALRRNTTYAPPAEEGAAGSSVTSLSEESLPAETLAPTSPETEAESAPAEGNGASVSEDASAEDGSSES